MPDQPDGTEWRQQVEEALKTISAEIGIELCSSSREIAYFTEQSHRILEVEKDKRDWSAESIVRLTIKRAAYIGAYLPHAVPGLTHKENAEALYLLSKFETEHRYRLCKRHDEDESNA